MDHFIEHLSYLRDAVNAQLPLSLLGGPDIPIEYIEDMLNILYVEYAKTNKILGLIKLVVDSSPNTKSIICQYMITGDPNILKILKDM